jgi:hypothetical protein
LNVNRTDNRRQRKIFRHINYFQCSQLTDRDSHLDAFAIEEPIAESSGQSESAVVSRASSQANDNCFGALARGVQYKLAHAKRCGMHRILFRLFQASHARGLAHFHHRKFTILDHRVTTLDDSAQSIMSGTIHRGPAQRLTDHLGCAFPPIGNRQEPDFSPG